MFVPYICNEGEPLLLTHMLMMMVCVEINKEHDYMNRFDNVSTVRRDLRGVQHHQESEDSQKLGHGPICYIRVLQRRSFPRQVVGRGP